MNRKAVSRMLVVVTIYGGYSIVPVTTPGMILQVMQFQDSRCSDNLRHVQMMFIYVSSVWSQVQIEVPVAASILVCW